MRDWTCQEHLPCSWFFVSWNLRFHAGAGGILVREILAAYFTFIDYSLLADTKVV